MEACRRKPCRHRLNLRLRTREPRQRNKGEREDREIHRTFSWIAAYGGRNKVPQRKQGICTGMIHLRRSRSRCHYHTTPWYLHGFSGNEGSADTMHDVLSKVPPFRNTSTNQELPDPNSVPTDFISREAKVWEAKSKATERNWKKRKKEEMICKICGESGHFTQGCPSTLGANRKITNMGLIENRDPPLPSMGSLPSQSQFDDSYVSSGPTETQKSLEEGGEGDFTVAIPGMASSQVDEGSSAETVLDPFANRDRRTTVETQTAPSTIMISIRLADGIGTALELPFRSNLTIRDIRNAIDERYPDNDGLRFAIGGWSRLHGLECNCIQSFYLWYSSLPDQTLAFVLVQCPLTDETEKERDGKRIHIDVEKDSCFV
ncbi:unnamed protein product [Brassica oleracea]